MLSIGKMGAGQEGYYLGKVAEGAEDYYSGEGEAEGYWLGDGAEDLGLQGKVDPDQLVGMLTGSDPASGEPLGLQPVSGKGPVPGFDLTFSAPKSVSLAWALGGDGAAAEVKAAHGAAVEAGLRYLERSACWTRRGKGGRVFLAGNGFLAAGYVHRSSRAGDPQLHTHVLVANAAFADGRWTRLYHPAIYEHARAAGFLYEAHLRDELTRRLGVRWGEVRNGIAEIEGFDPDHLRAFSTRRAEILEAAGDGASAKALQVATLATRGAKDRDLDTASLRGIWREKAAEGGLTRELVRSTFGRTHEIEERRITVAEVAAEVTAHASHFDRREAIQAIGNCLRSGAPGSEVEELADAFLRAPEVIRISSSPRAERFTTQEIWRLEERALATVAEMATRSDRAVVSEIVVSRVLSERPSLKPDQRAMVERLLARGEGVVVVVGEAGTGKTYAVLAAASGWSARMKPAGLTVAAPTWRAANVLRAEGLEATSVARLLAQLDLAARTGQPGLPRDSVLLVDEAGMVDSRALARLIHHAAEAEAKLVLVGDAAQLGEIEAGGLFAAIAERSEPVILDEVIRHRHDLDREGAKLIREGEGRDALAAYFQEGRIAVSADPDARREAMVADWWQSFSRGEDALMIARTNREVEALNARARAQMQAAGRLGSEEVEVGGARFAAGDQIVTRINDHAAGIYNRERWSIAAVDRRSGALMLDGIDTRGRVCVDAVYSGRLRERDEGPAIEHAYAATTYQAQGATVDRAYVAVDPSMDRQAIYVAASRSREETYFYAIPEVNLAREEFAPGEPSVGGGLDHIARAAERDGCQVAAHDAALRSEFAEMPTPELVACLRELRSEAGAEGQNQAAQSRIEERLREEAETLQSLRVQREAMPEPRRGKKAQERSERFIEENRISTGEEGTRERIEEFRSERSVLPDVQHEARARTAVAEHVLAERERLAATAARLSPPDYITLELGERPADRARAATWDRAVGGIEGYRLRHGVVDKGSALGPKPRQHSQAHDHAQAEWQLQQAQRRLQLERIVQRSTSLEIGL